MSHLPDPTAPGSPKRVLPTNVLPGIIRPTKEHEERAFSPYSLLLQARIIYLGTPVDDDVSNAVVSQLLYLAWEKPDEDIYLYINSPGGSVLDGMAIYEHHATHQARRCHRLPRQGCQHGAQSCYLAALRASATAPATPPC